LQARKFTDQTEDIDLRYGQARELLDEATKLRLQAKKGQMELDDLEDKNVTCHLHDQITAPIVLLDCLGIASYHCQTHPKSFSCQRQTG
jgi:hypothetical protein